MNFFSPLDSLHHAVLYFFIITVYEVFSLFPFLFFTQTLPQRKVFTFFFFKKEERCSLLKYPMMPVSDSNLNAWLTRLLHISQI
jgi:hypothetical protein